MLLTVPVVALYASQYLLRPPGTVYMAAPAAAPSPGFPVLLVLILSAS